MAPESADAVAKTKRPADSAFKQQRLPAWQPILTAGTVLPTFFVIGVAFIPIGVGLLYFSNDVKEYTLDYTDCTSPNNTKCVEVIAKDPNADCKCVIPFQLDTDFKAKVYMYYGLTNYYQNHRRYVRSRDDYQLLGKLENPPSTDCVPFAVSYNNDTGKEETIVPCGAIANSLFNDVLEIYQVRSGQKKVEVPLLRTGIAWDSDKKVKFKNPDAPNGLKDAFKGYQKPKAWKKHIYELDEQDQNNNGLQNEDLIVWMRTAALPTFRKLYRRVNHTADGYDNGLAHGDYELHVQYSYDVSAFSGRKRMILSTTSLLGGKNPFLGIAYIVVGCICILLGVTLLFIHIKCGKSTSEMISVNPRTPWTPN